MGGALMVANRRDVLLRHRDSGDGRGSAALAPPPGAWLRLLTGQEVRLRLLLPGEEDDPFPGDSGHL